MHERIRFFRVESGMSQEEMAEHLNVSRQTVSKWERGISVPDAEMMVRIAEILKISLSQLYDEELGDQGQTLDISPILSYLKRIEDYKRKEIEIHSKLLTYVKTVMGAFVGILILLLIMIFIW